MRKFISVFLALMMVLSLTTVAFSAYNVVDEDVTTITEATADYEPLARLYFMMPNGHNGDYGADGNQAPSWLNEYNLAADGNYYAGIYMWGSTASPDAWPGYRMEIEDADQFIYYADVVGDDATVNLIFNNGVDGGLDTEDPIYYCAAQTSDLNGEGADEGDYDSIPLGTWRDGEDDYRWDFDGFIFVVDPDQVDESPLSHKQTCGGNWYAYYGNGCYGNFSEYQSDGYVSPEVNCLNPDHWVDGVHVGYQGGSGDATEAPTEAHVHTPGEAVQENVVPATYKAGGSYDSVVYCTECGEEISRETVNTDPITLEASKIYFDAASTGWTMGAKDKIGFHIFGGDLENGLAWGAKKAVGSATAGTDGLWEVDPASKMGYTLNPGVQYKIIFTHVVNNAWTDQTYDLFFTTDCLGHVAYSDGTTYENPVDSSKSTLAAYWYDMDDAVNGPVLQITSIGNVVGTCPAQGQTPESIFTNFATVPVEDFGGKTGLENARYYTVEQAKTKTEQEMIDDIGAALGLTKKQVYDVFTDNNVETAWDHSVSTLPGEVTEPTEAPTEEATEPAPAVKYIVAGVDTVFGTNWNGNDEHNLMTEGEDGVYYKEYTVDKAIENVQFKVVKDGTDWIGDETGNNVTFNLTGAGTFTAYCDGTKAWVEGDIVEFPDLEIESVTAVGNGLGKDGDTWLNKESWNQAAEINHMTGKDGVYTYTTTVGDNDTDENGNLEANFKFAINDAWTHNFGLAKDGVVENGVETDAGYNGDNIVLNFKVGTVVDMKLDLTNFDFKTKTGAKMTITWTEPSDQPTEAPTEVPTEAAPKPKGSTFYLIGDIESLGGSVWDPTPGLEMVEVEKDVLYKFGPVELKKAELGVDQYGNPIKNSDPDGPEYIGDGFKVGKSSKKGNTIASYYPDGVENNRTVSEDGTYTIWFRPNGDGNPEEGWQKVYTMSDPEGDPAAHGCTKGGYMYKIVKEGGEEPTTAAPTEVPTEAPTQAPTEEVTEPAPAVKYIVAGVDAVFGTNWNGNDEHNLMTEGEDGVYYKEYTVDKAIENVQFKVVKDGTDWIGDETGNNVTFNLTGAGTFTAYCDGTKAWVEGDIVEFPDLEIESVTAVGNGLGVDGDTWLNRESWNQAAEINHMTGKDGVYTYTTSVGEDDTDENGNLQANFKFAINDAWTHNFGLAKDGVVENGVETDAGYNGDNIVLNFAVGTIVEMKLDLTNFDFKTKTGAKMTISWFGPDSYILGDASGDDYVDTVDVALVQRFDAMMSTDPYTEAELMRADVDGDGELTILDATLIQRYDVQMTVKYPIGERVNPPA